MILIAPSLPCENWISMDLYAEKLTSELGAMTGIPEWKNVCPSPNASVSKPERLFLRRIGYPLTIRWHAAIQKNSILHVLDHSNGHLCRYHPCSIVTCHDIAEYRETALNSRQLQDWKGRVEGIKKAKRIIAVSNHTKSDLVDFLGIPETKIDVAHNGVDPLFKPWSKADVADRIPELETPRLKILHLGSNILRKNLPTLVRALGILRDRGIDFLFVKVGHEFSAELVEVIHKAGVGDRVIHLGKRPAEELPMIYSLCDLFVFPSTYEGFGLPVLEAQACGTPVILADSSCLPEVGGDGALYFPPHDEGALAEQILRLADPAARAPLVAAGYANAAKFTWKAHAEKVVRAYRMIG